MGGRIGWAAVATVLGLAAAGLAAPGAGATTVASVRVEQVIAIESQDGVVTATVPITLYAPSITPVTLDYATHPSGGSDGIAAATPDVDYRSTSGSLTFVAPGEVQKDVKVAILPDTLSEPAEDFFVGIRNVIGTTVSRSDGVVRIDSNGGQAELTGSYAIFDSQARGRAPKYTAKVAFVLGQKLDHAVTGTYSEIPNTAQPGVDYVAKTGSIVIPAGKVMATVTIKLLKRAPSVDLRQFNVALTSLTGVSGQSFAMAHVEIDGPAPSVSQRFVTSARR